MSPSEYYNVFEAIFYSLALAQILSGWVKMIRSAGDYKLYWCHFLLTLVLFLAIVQRYSASLTQDGEISYGHINNGIDLLYHIVLSPSLLYIGASLLIPRKLQDLDFKTFMIDNRWKVFSPVLLFITIQLIGNIIAGLGWVFIIPHAIWISLGLLAIYKKYIRLLEILVITAFGMVLYYLLIT